MLWSFKDVEHAAALNHSSCVHDDHFVAEFSNDTEVVGDHYDR
jgi:hypothetical protein